MPQNAPKSSSLSLSFQSLARVACHISNTLGVRVRPDVVASLYKYFQPLRNYFLEDSMVNAATVGPRIIGITKDWARNLAKGAEKQGSDPRMPGTTNAGSHDNNENEILMVKSPSSCQRCKRDWATTRFRYLQPAKLSSSRWAERQNMNKM